MRADIAQRITSASLCQQAAEQETATRAAVGEMILGALTMQADAL